MISFTRKPSSVSLPSSSAEAVSLLLCPPVTPLASAVGPALLFSLVHPPALNGGHQEGRDHVMLVFVFCMVPHTRESFRKGLLKENPEIVE